ncbi:hypothetical protein H8E88_04760 [candidate division KSB1 bacterium]|nr:hypothetical protein [candidate division KSB1 bacterium]
MSDVRSQETEFRNQGTDGRKRKDGKWEDWKNLGAMNVDGRMMKEKDIRKMVIW